MPLQPVYRKGMRQPDTRTQGVGLLDFHGAVRSGVDTALAIQQSKTRTAAAIVDTHSKIAMLPEQIRAMKAETNIALAENEREAMLHPLKLDALNTQNMINQDKHENWLKEEPLRAQQRAYRIKKASAENQAYNVDAETAILEGQTEAQLYKLGKINEERQDNRDWDSSRITWKGKEHRLDALPDLLQTYGHDEDFLAAVDPIISRFSSSPNEGRRNIAKGFSGAVTAAQERRAVRANTITDPQTGEQRPARTDEERMQAAAEMSASSSPRDALFGEQALAQTRESIAKKESARITDLALQQTDSRDPEVIAKIEAQIKAREETEALAGISQAESAAAQAQTDLWIQNADNAIAKIIRNNGGIGTMLDAVEGGADRASTLKPLNDALDAEFAKLTEGMGQEQIRTYSARFNLEKINLENQAIQKEKAAISASQSQLLSSMDPEMMNPIRESWQGTLSGLAPEDINVNDSNLIEGVLRGAAGIVGAGDKSDPGIAGDAKSHSWKDSSISWFHSTSPYRQRFEGKADAAIEGLKHMRSQLPMDHPDRPKINRTIRVFREAKKEVGGAWKNLIPNEIQDDVMRLVDPYNSLVNNSYGWLSSDSAAEESMTELIEAFNELAPFGMVQQHSLMAQSNALKLREKHLGEQEMFYKNIIKVGTGGATESVPFRTNAAGKAGVNAPAIPSPPAD